MANTENILKVADAIERQSVADLGFNMGMWVCPTSDEFPDKSGHNCGTVACIAGWTAAVVLGDVQKTEALGQTELGELLGLDGDESFDLFYAEGRTEDDLRDVPQEQAVRTLRHLAATGNVDWTV